MEERGRRGSGRTYLKVAKRESKIIENNREKRGDGEVLNI